MPCLACINLVLVIKFEEYCKKNILKVWLCSNITSGYIELGCGFIVVQVGRLYPGVVAGG